MTDSRSHPLMLASDVVVSVRRLHEKIPEIDAMLEVARVPSGCYALSIAPERLAVMVAVAGSVRMYYVDVPAVDCSREQLWEYFVAILDVLDLKVAEHPILGGTMFCTLGAYGTNSPYNPVQYATEQPLKGVTRLGITPGADARDFICEVWARRMEGYKACFKENAKGYFVIELDTGDWFAGTSSTGTVLSTSGWSDAHKFPASELDTARVAAAILEGSRVFYVESGAPQLVTFDDD